MRDLTERYPGLFAHPHIICQLAAATLAQAVLDARTNTQRKGANPGALAYQQRAALIWLNRPRAAQLAELIGLELPATITPETLQATARQRLRPQGRRREAVAP